MKIKSVKFVEAFYDEYGIIDAYNKNSPEIELIDPNCEVNACLVQEEDIHVMGKHKHDLLPGKIWLFAGEQAFLASKNGHIHKAIVQLDREQGETELKWIDKTTTYEKNKVMVEIVAFLDKNE